MDEEKIQKLIDDKLSAVSDRLEKLEKSIQPPATEPNEPAEPTEIEKKLEESLTAISERLEKLEKASNGSQRAKGQDGGEDKEVKPGLKFF